jgi:uncharacterized protein (TIGR00251 family)
MRINVHVTPRARHANIDRTERTRFRVAVTAPPHDGRANEEVIDLLAEYFRVPRSRVRIVRGHTARHKIMEISDESTLFGFPERGGSEVK